MPHFNVYIPHWGAQGTDGLAACPEFVKFDS